MSDRATNQPESAGSNPFSLPDKVGQFPRSGGQQQPKAMDKEGSIGKQFTDKCSPSLSSLGYARRSSLR